MPAAMPRVGHRMPRTAPNAPANSQAARSGKYLNGTPTISWITRITFGSRRTFATPENSTIAASKIVMARYAVCITSILYPKALPTRCEPSVGPALRTTSGVRGAVPDPRPASALLKIDEIRLGGVWGNFSGLHPGGRQSPQTRLSSTMSGQPGTDHFYAMATVRLGG